jgi:hypothetical protein
MSTETSLWGTFSVADHLRERPFVADVLLYDRLVVPVAENDSEVERWAGLGRNPLLQQDLLGIMGELAVPVPWSLQRHDQWASRYAAVAQPATEASVRDDVAQAVTFDLRNVEQARGGSAPGTINPDDPAYLMTRMVLADEYGSGKDHALVDRIPRMDRIETVVAYGSYDAFADERGALPDASMPGGEPVFKFSWAFFVPEDSQRSDADLLRAAVELAHTDEVVDWRAAVQRWRYESLRKGQSDEDAERDMEALIKEYAEAARKRKITVAARFGFAVAATLGGVAAVFVPPAGLAAAFGLGTLIPSREIPKRLEAAAMFHEARRRLA